MKRPWPCATLALGLAALALHMAMPPAAIAQNTRSKPTVTKEKNTSEPEKHKPAPVWSPPPYEPKLLRLSEIMGALAFLQSLCASDEGAEWRTSMQQLIASEGKTPEQKARLAGAYNAGYRGYQLNYRRCTDNARLVISRYFSEGGKIAQDLATRYGSG
ncbi:MAG: TIGR02301 family protein [Beijerinckiaceae bacterium]|nr:TIGR02301 family protein [Beijerinckiaceae bacterium]